MKLSTISFAVAAVAALASAPASASLLSQFNVPVANTMFMSGASALTGSLTAVMAKLCTGGAPNVRTLTIGGGTSDGRVFVCTTSGVAGAQFAGPFALVKRDTDGSFAGVGPVISQTNLLRWANIASCSATNCALDTTTPIKPNAGLTDVDTNVWVGSSNTGALSIPVPALGSTQAFGGFAGQGFGVMVSEELYKAMQIKQKAEGRLPSTVVVGDYTPGAAQPSITKEEYAAVIDGGNFAYVNNGALSGDANPVNLCRRVETSGTQAVSNAYFLNNPCAAASPTNGFVAPKRVDLANPTAVVFASPANAVTGNYDDFGGAFGLFEGSGTGDARNCVSRRNAGNNPNNVADPALGKYAIGFISLENPTQSGWKYVKLDGVSPDAYQVPVGSAADIAGGGASDGWAQDATRRISTIRAQYPISPEFQMLWPNGSTFNTFFTKLKDTFSDPTALSTPGVFQANNPALGSTFAAFPTQVHKGTRNGNFCAPQVLAE